LFTSDDLAVFVGDTTLPADQSYMYLNVDDAKDLRYHKVTLAFTEELSQLNVRQ